LHHYEEIPLFPLWQSGIRGILFARPGKNFERRL